MIVPVKSVIWTDFFIPNVNKSTLLVEFDFLIYVKCCDFFKSQHL